MSELLVPFLVTVLGGVLSQQVSTDLDFICSVSSPCKNSATCSVTSGQIYCVCTDGFTGALCDQKKMDPCQPNPCQNGGTCMDEGLSATCFCPAEFTGPNCTAGLQQPNFGPQQGSNPGEFPNTGGLSNTGVVDNPANADMGLGGAVFRLGSAERNLNPDLSASLGNPDFGMSNSPGGGNVAGGLSNQPVHQPNTAPHADNAIQQDLKNTFILHNFMKGGLQQLLAGNIGGNQPDVQNTNQVNQLKKLIGSPKKIQDAFPDQKLVDGNAVAVGSSGTAVGVSFKDPTQHVHDLPSSFTPSKINIDNQNAIDFSNHVCKGRQRENKLNSKLYYVIEPQHAPHRMQCPPGVLFSLKTCDCTLVPTQPKEKACAADLINNFDYGMDESSGNFFSHFASKDLQPEQGRGVLCFNGSQQMGYPRYRSYDFTHDLFIVISFMTTVNERDQLFPLLTNCELNELTNEYRDPSIGIVVNRTNDLVVFVETDHGMSLTSFEFSTGIWNTVTLQYDGNMFIASLNGRENPIHTTGKIKIRHAPLRIGYCERYGYFDGCVDDVQIFPCIPPNKSFIKRMRGFP